VKAGLPKKSVAQQNQKAFDRAFPNGPRKHHTSEWYVHKKVVEFLRNQYPQYRFYTSLDGFDLGQQRSLLSSIQWINTDTHEMGGFPDLLIFGQPPMAIELKKEGIKVGKDKHTIKQQGWLEVLRSVGFIAEFAVGIEEAKSLINKHYGTKKKINRK
jgi:hypothetical protein